MADTSKARPHGMDLLGEILAGAMDPEQARRILRTPDRKGLLPSEFAALAAARDAHDLLALKQLLEPPEDGQDRLAQIAELLQALTAKVEAVEARQARLEAAVLTSLDAISLSLRRIAAGSRT